MRKDYTKGDIQELVKILGRRWESINSKGLRMKLKRDRKFNIGENNGQWRGGKSWNYYRRIAFENYPKKCDICGAIKNLQVHHRDKNHKNNHIKNLQILCHKCHTTIHRESKGWYNDYDHCQVCGRCDIKHNAHGLCMNCYSKIKYKSKRFKKRPKNPTKTDNGR